MDPSGHQLFSGATFAGDEHGGVDGGDLDNPLEDFSNRVRFANDPGNGLEPLPVNRSPPHKGDLVRSRLTLKRLYRAEILSSPNSIGTREHRKKWDAQVVTS